MRVIEPSQFLRLGFGEGIDREQSVMAAVLVLVLEPSWALTLMS